MNYPHRIRLRGPWQCQPLDSDLPARRVNMPGRLPDFGLANYAGRLCLTRNFGYPGKIDDYERVWLTFADVVGHGEFSLNGQLLGSTSDNAEFDATTLLGPRNRLEVNLLADSDRCGLAGEVALEVRCRAYLKNVSAQSDASRCLRVQGNVAGDADEVLELYMLADGMHVHYATIRAGEAFSVALGSIHARHIRVDLIHVSTIWYTTEIALK